MKSSALCLLMVTSPVLAQPGTEGVEQLKREMPQQLRQLESQIKNNPRHYELKLTIEDVAGKSTLADFQSTFKSKNGNSLFINISNGSGSRVSSGRSKAKSPNSRNLKGCNSFYSFSLERNAGDTAWLLTSIDKADSPEGSKVVTDLDKQRDQLDSFATKIGTLEIETYLPDLFARPDVELQSVTANGDNVDATFTYRVSAGDYKGSLSRVQMTFAQSLNWLPVKWQEKLTTSSGTECSATTTRDVKRSPTGYSFQTVVEERLQGGGINQHMRRTIQFEATTPASIQDADFRLPAYGLAEPAGFELPSRPLHVYLLIATAVCVALVVMFRLLARQRSR